MDDVRSLLEGVRSGKISVDEAALKLKEKPFEDIDFAKVDLHRHIRQGVAEVIYGAGKSAEQIDRIVEVMQDNGQDRILITRLAPAVFNELSQKDKMHYHEDALIATVGENKTPDGKGKIVIATGGTSDIRVAQEAAVTAEFLGNEVVRIFDVGVAGIHRLMSRLDDIMTAKVIIAIAGMEGALASVIGGLADCPVIAVPTSVGYGAAFDGLAALLSMLNSCASGVVVTNIDNGFGAGYTADLINHVSGKDKSV